MKEGAILVLGFAEGCFVGDDETEGALLVLGLAETEGDNVGDPSLTSGVMIKTVVGAVGVADGPALTEGALLTVGEVGAPLTVGTGVLADGFALLVGG